MSQLNLNGALLFNTDIVVNGGEVKTGATFNGKPVYCDCFEYNVGSKNGTDSLVMKTIPNVAKFVNVIGYNGTSYTPIIQMWSSIIGDIFTVQADGRVGFGYSCPSAYNFGTVRVTVWYTKTTD